MRNSVPNKRKSSVASEQAYEILNDRYELIKSVGKGNTSEVFMARDRKNPQELQAVKIYHEDFLTERQGYQKVENEIETLRSLKHPNIISIYDHGKDGQINIRQTRVIAKNLTYTSMEYVSGGSLFDICTDLGPMDESVVHFFVSQLVNALSYVHKNGVVHLDIKPENILSDD